MKKFKDLLIKLEEQGIPIKASRYYDELMGSWNIVTDTNPLFRIVHDGRDKTIVLEKFENEWSSLLADKTKSGNHVISKLITELNNS